VYLTITVGKQIVQEELAHDNTDIVYEDEMEMPNSLDQGLPKGSTFHRRFAEACYTFKAPAVHRDGEPKPTDGQDAPRNRS